MEKIQVPVNLSSNAILMINIPEEITSPGFPKTLDTEIIWKEIFRDFKSLVDPNNDSLLELYKKIENNPFLNAPYAIGISEMAFRALDIIFKDTPIKIKRCDSLQSSSRTSGSIIYAEIPKNIKSEDLIKCHSIDCGKLVIPLIEIILYGNNFFKDENLFLLALETRDSSVKLGKLFARIFRIYFDKLFIDTGITFSNSDIILDQNRYVRDNSDIRQK